MKVDVRSWFRAMSGRTNLSAATVGPWIVGFIFATPTLIVHYPPMTDLPFHEGIVGGLVHWGDNQLFSKTIYALNFGHPNQLFHILSWFTALLVGTTAAVKLVVAGSQVATTLASARLAKHLGTPWWACQIVAASTIGWLYFWGLVANMLGLAIMLFALPSLDRFVKEPNARRSAVASVWMVLLYFAHESSLLCTLLVMGTFALLQPFRLRRWLWYALPVAVAGTLGVGQVILQSALMSSVVHASTRDVVFDIPSARLLMIAQTIGGYYPFPIDWALMSLVLLPIVLGGLVRTLWGAPTTHRDEDTRFGRVRGWLSERRFPIAAGLLFVFYMAAPTQVLAATFVHQRFLPPAFALLALWAIPASTPVVRGLRAIRLARVASTLALAGPLLTAWPAFYEADLVYSQLDNLIPLIEPGQAVFVQDTFSRPRTFLFTPGTACGHILARKGGRCAYDFTQSPIAALRMKNEEAWPSSAARLLAGPDDWPIPAHEFRRFRYMFLWVPPQYSALGEITEEVLKPTAKVIAREGQWVLFESTILKYSVDSIPERPPKPGAHPSLKRLVLEEVLRRYPDEAQRP